MSDKNPPANGQDQSIALPRRDGDGGFGEFWAYEEFSTGEDPPADSTTSLVSLAFIRAAIRRSLWFWCSTAVAGLLAGIVFYAAFPPAYQASALVLLTHAPGSDPANAISDDQAIAQSRTVAGMALHKLGLAESVSSFDAAYTTTPITSRVLQITVSAPSSADAVSRANAVASAFIQFRAGQLQTQQTLEFRSLDQQVNQARQKVSSLTAQVHKLSHRPASATQQATLRRLRTERSQANAKLGALEQAANGTEANDETITTSQVTGSKVLDAAAPVPESRLKLLLYYAVGGLFTGLAASIALVVVRALMSDRLRLREDVARALGAPVKLSVATAPPSRWRLLNRWALLSRWWPGRRDLSADDPDIRRVAAHLRGTVPARSRGPAALAVVPVDDTQIAALALVSTALSRAEDGGKVVVADLASGAPVAHLLGAGQPGVRAVSVRDAHLLVAVPDAEDVLPVGPLDRPGSRAERSPFTGAVAAACASADLVLTLAPLDPSLGGEHLATWATAAVVVVTTGRSTATRVHAIGEMIRLAGTTLASAVVVGADKADQSLGMRHTPGADRDAETLV